MYPVCIVYAKMSLSVRSASESVGVLYGLWKFKRYILL